MYCIDTSSVIHLRYYSSTIHVSLWAKLAQLTRDGRLKTPREVERELEVGGDARHAWVRAQAGLVVEDTQELVDTSREVVDRFRALANPEASRPVADSFVVALALTLERRRASSTIPEPRPVVVAQERRTVGGSGQKIPDACDLYGIECLDLDGMIIAEGWSF